MLHIIYFLVNLNFVFSFFVYLNMGLEYLYCKITKEEVDYDFYENHELIFLSPLVFLFLIYYINITLWTKMKM